jgi:hypothetical protein
MWWAPWRRQDVLLSPRAFSVGCARMRTVAQRTFAAENGQQAGGEALEACSATHQPTTRPPLTGTVENACAFVLSDVCSAASPQKQDARLQELLFGAQKSVSASDTARTASARQQHARRCGAPPPSLSLLSARHRRAGNGESGTCRNRKHLFPVGHGRFPRGVKRASRAAHARPEHGKTRHCGAGCSGVRHVFRLSWSPAAARAAAEQLPTTLRYLD